MLGSHFIIVSSVLWEHSMIVQPRGKQSCRMWPCKGDWSSLKS
jgi:hypothetical protein